MVTNKIRPYKSNADHRRKSGDTVDITHVGILNVETGGFHRPETRLDLPTFFYVEIPSSGLLKQMRICNSAIPSEFLVRLPAR